MSVKKVLKEIDFLPSKKELKDIKNETNKVLELLKRGIEKREIDADVFLGGSLAKGTIIKKGTYDVDIFVRFNWKYEDLSDYLEKAIKGGFRGYDVKKVHGSRDYFRISKDEKIIFEIIPVSRIKKPEEARNVTDLSYFHVRYVKRKINQNKELGREIALAKAFFKANRIYGAESYVSGFSGYALECLVINYKSFENMLKKLSKVEKRVVLDPEKKYRKKEDILFDLNDSKLQSPIILVDPTWKERNVIAALNQETFEKFKKISKEFLKKPSKEFFEDSKIDIDSLKKLAKKKKGEFINVKLKTDKQEGDIAGTKMKKFAKHLSRELNKMYEVIEMDFDYEGKKESEVYFVVKSKKEIIKFGPPVGMKKHAKKFKKENKNVYEKDWKLYAKVKVKASAKKFLEVFKKDNKDKLKDMNIVSFKIV